MEKKTLKRSGEFHAIIFKKPAWIIRWGMVMIWGIILLLLLLAAFLRTDKEQSLLSLIWEFISI